MKNPLKFSPEGLPWKDYKIFQFFAAAPISYPVGLYLEAVWRLSKDNARTVGIEDVPENAILYDFHVDVCLNYMTMHLLREAGRKVIFAVSHDFDSYLAAGPGSFGAYESWRFDRRFSTSPTQQIVEMLKNNPKRVLGIFTDGAGGKRFKVRNSLVKLAIESQRPLVPYRSLYGPSVRLFGDDYPGVFIKGNSLFGKPIDWKVVQSMELEQASLYLEKALLSLSRERFR